VSAARSVELDNAFFIEDGQWFESLTVAATAEIDPKLIAELSGIRLFQTDEIPTGPSDVHIRRFTLVAQEPYPFILGVVLRQEAIPNRIVLQHNTFEVVATVRNWQAVDGLAEEIRETFGRFDLDSVTDIDRAGEPLDSGRLSEVLISKLSEEQLVVLETAYQMGYFEVPREASASDLADELGIAQSTVSERLRVAQHNLFDLIYGDRDIDDSHSASAPAE